MISWFMVGLLSFFRMHWDHELPGGCSAGVLACGLTGRLARCSCWRRDAAATRSRDGCATRFMESPRFRIGIWFRLHRAAESVRHAFVLSALFLLLNWATCGRAAVVSPIHSPDG